jgi:hypothetical protein
MMLKKLSIVLTLGFCLTGVAMAAEAPAAGPTSVDRLGCSTGASLTLASLGTPEAVPTAGGEVVFKDATPCCYSDPCPGWGSQGVSCCADGCSAWSDRVWCSHTGFIYCPDPCASNGICNQSCGSSDPDCQSCQCSQGASCFDDSDCDCDLGWGYCYKEEPFQIMGSCSCYF